MSDLREVVADRIANSGPQILERVATIMAEEVIEKRVKQVVSAMTELANLERDARKLKPDVIAYDATGAKVSEAYSKSQIEALDKNKKRIEKVQRALDKALDKGDFGDLLSLGDNKSKPSSDEE